MEVIYLFLEGLGLKSKTSVHIREISKFLACPLRLHRIEREGRNKLSDEISHTQSSIKSALGDQGPMKTAS